jgi:hypothetical protein
MTYRPTQLPPEDIYWEEPFWQIINAESVSSQLLNRLESVIVHRCDSTTDPLSYRRGLDIPRVYWGHLRNLDCPCWHCGAYIPDRIQTLWTLQNADKHDNTQNRNV